MRLRRKLDAVASAARKREYAMGFVTNELPRRYVAYLCDPAKVRRMPDSPYAYTPLGAERESTAGSDQQ